MPPVKEFHYFDRSTDYPSLDWLSEARLFKRLQQKGYFFQCLNKVVKAFLRGQFQRAKWFARFYFSNYSDKWYLSLFNVEGLISGDITPSYSILDEVDVRRMKELVPDAKIIFLIRNPIDRSWSNVRFRAGRCGTTVNLDDFNSFKGKIESESHTLRSNYLRTIDLFLKYYGEGQLLIGFYDAIELDPDGLLSNIQRHIGCQNVVCPDNVKRRINSSKKLDIPDQFYAYLKAKYKEDIDELADRFGGYARKWQLEMNGESTQSLDESTPLAPVVRPRERGSCSG